MPFYPPRPRKRGYYKKYAKGMPRYKKAPVHAASVLQAAVRRAIAQNNEKMMETKKSNQTVTDGVEIFHNNFVTLNSTLLTTSQGVQDAETSALANRIGDEINLKGLSVRLMVELNERYSDVTFRFLVIKSAKGDTPSRSTLFTGLSGNKMLDQIDYERYSILFQKYFKIKAPNQGTRGGDAGPALQPAGFNFADQNNQSLSRATKLMKFWIPGKKFVKSGVLKYEGGSGQPKFFDYHAVLYAYSNYTTLQDFYYVGRVNEAIFQLYYKDA